MNDDFIKHALNNGEEGKRWLESIPHSIAAYEKKWSFKALPPFPLSYNYVAPVVLSDESEAVVKIGFPKDKEFQTEIQALEIFNGEGAERLLREDRKHAIILIEKVTPGVPLSIMEDDEEATRIIARVMKKLWKPLPPRHTFLPIARWIQEIYPYREKYSSKKHTIPKAFVDKAITLFEELLATSREAVLVHGDLHHDNILSSNRSEWLAIDPKGIAAEPVYETAAMIRNPYGKMKNASDLENILRKRILILSEELGYDPQRILKWCFAQTVLSGVWSDAGVKGAVHAVAIAKVLDTLKV